MIPRNIVRLLGTLTLLAVGSLTDALASDEADDGEQLSEQCAKCHSLEVDERKIDPSLFGLFGREGGSYEVYRNSRALRDTGITWDEPSLAAFLANLRDFYPGTTMLFGSTDDEHDRELVVALCLSSGSLHQGTMTAAAEKCSSQ